MFRCKKITIFVAPQYFSNRPMSTFLFTAAFRSVSNRAPFLLDIVFPFSFGFSSSDLWLVLGPAKVAVVSRGVHEGPTFVSLLRIVWVVRLSRSLTFCCRSALPPCNESFLLVVWGDGAIEGKAFTQEDSVRRFVRFSFPSFIVWSLSSLYVVTVRTIFSFVSFWCLSE